MPRYAEARSIFSGEQSIRSAAEFGSTVFGKPSIRLADAVEQIQAFTPTELQAARLGFLDWLADEAAKTSTRSNRLVNKFAEQPRLQELTRAIFPDQGAVNDFINAASTRQTFGQTRNTVLGGSPTARIQSDRGGLEP